MDCRITSIKNGPRSGHSLVEVLIASGLSSLLMMVVATFSCYGARNCVSMANYAELESQSRLALDQMTQQIRQTRSLQSFSSTNLVFKDADGAALEFLYNPTEKTLTRIKSGESKVLLNRCDLIKFDIFQRNPVGGSYDAYPTATAATAKLIQVSWICSRTLLGAKLSSESVQSAKIVIRKRS